MRRSMIMVALLAGLATSGAAGQIPDVASAASAGAAADRAAIELIEADWTRAFLAKDYDRIEQIVAPEFKLVGWGDGAFKTTLRAAWMTNARMFDFKVYETKLLDLVVVNDTAVASVSGNWTVGIGDKVMPNDRFLVTDVWVRRGGRWQVVLRSAQSID